MAGLSRLRRREPPPLIDVRNEKNEAGINDDDDKERQPSPTRRVLKSPTKAAQPSIGQTRTLLLPTTVTIRISTSKTGALLPTTTTTAQISTPQMDDPLPTTTIRFATTEASAAPAGITTNSGQTSNAVISGPGAAFIGSVGLAGMSSREQSCWGEACC